jgi:hypothetical protein
MQHDTLQAYLDHPSNATWEPFATDALALKYGRVFEALVKFVRYNLEDELPNSMARLGTAREKCERLLQDIQDMHRSLEEMRVAQTNVMWSVVDAMAKDPGDCCGQWDGAMRIALELAPERLEALTAAAPLQPERDTKGFLEELRSKVANERWTFSCDDK